MLVWESVTVWEIAKTLETSPQEWSCFDLTLQQSSSVAWVCQPNGVWRQMYQVNESNYYKKPEDVPHCVNNPMLYGWCFYQTAVIVYSSDVSCVCLLWPMIWYWWDRQWVSLLNDLVVYIQHLKLILKTVKLGQKPWIPEYGLHFILDCTNFLHYYLAQSSQSVIGFTRMSAGMVVNSQIILSRGNLLFVLISCLLNVVVCRQGQSTVILVLL